MFLNAENRIIKIILAVKFKFSFRLYCTSLNNTNLTYGNITKNSTTAEHIPHYTEIGTVIRWHALSIPVTTQLLPICQV
jgi:hypothetical protein